VRPLESRAETADTAGAAVSRSGRARLLDVALEAGVSKGIASRVLNNFDVAIRPETRRRVIAAASKLRYQPHASARNLRSRLTGAVALIVPDLTNPVYARMIRGAFAEASRSDVSLLLIEDQPDIEGQLAKLVLSGRVDGLVIASAAPDHLVVSALPFEVPHVFLNRTVPGSGRNVTMDDWSTGRVALEYLYALGHRRIGHIAGPPRLSTAQVRIDSFRHHAEELGLETYPVVSGEFSEEGGANAALQLLEESPTVTAMTSSILAQAVGVLHVVWKRGLSVPSDISILAYDDLALAAYLQPPLTTIWMPLEELGSAGVAAVVAQISGGPSLDAVVATAPQLVVRESTDAPSH
jgi:DNA-binding LacI/PurR family transcriptional regulator